MSAPANRQRPLARLTGRLAAVCLWISAAALHAAEPSADPVHYVRIAQQPPACASPPGMPIVPNDPGALVTPAGIRCYGAGTASLELWLPENRYLWLERRGPGPAAWFDLGPVPRDAAPGEVPPLGLRLSTADGSWRLEVRQGETAILSRLQPGGWQEITSPGGERFWIRAGDRPPAGAGERVRRRAD